MIYEINMFNVIFWIQAVTEQEKRNLDMWWHYFVNNPDMHRVSVVLAFLKQYKLDFTYKWSWCRDLSVSDNIRAYFGFKRQIRDFFKVE